jgi:hypothetical protein
MALSLQSKSIDLLSFGTRPAQKIRSQSNIWATKLNAKNREGL